MTLRLLLFLLLHLWSLPARLCTSHLAATANQSHFFDLMRQFLSGPAIHAWRSAADAAPYCNFTGISCDGRGFVEAIDISSWSLSGRFPSDVCSYLPALRVLRIGANNLRGGFPAGVLNCSFLEELDVSSSGLSGEFPDFSSMTSLRVLDTSGNVFIGSFPTSIFNLTQLESVNFNENHGYEPWRLPEELTRDPSVDRNMTSLVDLELCGNYLKGQIPATIGKLAKLRHLELYYNLLGGAIPSEIGNLSQLTDLDISVNQLSGSIPGEVLALPHLRVVQFYSNCLRGELPSVVGNSTSLTIISLYQNFLTGQLPATLGSSSELMVLEVSENRLSGGLPPDICAGGRLQYFLVLDNQFSGELPQSYGRCESLLRFRVSYNMLGGAIPEGLLGLPHISILDLSFNHFEGRIWRTIGNGKNLSALFVQNNRISGSLPPEISRATTLTKIDLSNNLLSGAIPEELGNLIELNQLSLQGNKLVSSIPRSLSALKNLNVLNLSNNHLTGEIPESLCSLLPSSIDFSNNQFSGPVPLPLLREGLTESFAGNPGLCLPTHPITLRLNNIWFIGASAVLCTIATLVLVKRSIYKKGAMAKHDEASSSSSLSYDVTSFHKVSFRQREIVDSLVEKNIVGQGGSGTVYKIQLSNGDWVAVKKLWTRKATKDSPSGRLPLQREIKTEVEMLGSIRHKNIVKLYCCFSSSDSNLLVYEYMSNGNLWDALHNGWNFLDWRARHRIALGIAQGLTSNILLDADFEPKVADFGIAKVLQAGGEKDSTATSVAGTYGYMAPVRVLLQSDDQGRRLQLRVVLMELVTGRKPTGEEFGENRDLVQWVSSKAATREGAAQVLDKSLSACPLRAEMIGSLGIALRCTRTAPALRPSMNEVVQLLAEASACRRAEEPKRPPPARKSGVGII
ncbi:unnamed protein product [Spirodela intermedia]|uniref:non-specific serine/threonine protein kinase n=1 Tax=Spirodela intermedia TaxID=51605 RepID=A0A7I8IID3_SPIIN|nr:unnamed protein product [Spirodela intermedia]CAA6657633.1 unnamed protein product [Spirodela intermedia]